MRLMIQNMVCDRCVESVQQLFRSMDIPIQELELGRAETKRILTPGQLEEVAKGLESRGFALIQNREAELVGRVKVELLHYLRHLEEQDHPEKLSTFIAGKLHYNYSYLSKLFSDVEGETVETYLIRLKIERVKELLAYQNLTLSEIAWQLNYSSVQYLSNQFKKVTGETVTRYRKRGTTERIPLDKL